eukprot:CAMPEP_0172486386 /NCGR_PEP_ID=MMETSP1066-20121228/14946_1 /TAXON_ID=671091 /ORGANISM="Coscinodiscus wailesii, Strain CCMP2513" /LENGTH=177 /DNA_ID=CAMNT_0013252303 /DNA_START=133 /DNA_END=666 /DNA_ORIENTATION=-
MLNLANILDPIQSSLIYLRQNAWSIVFALAVGYTVKIKLLDPYTARERERASYAEATRPDRVAALKADMKRVRAAQQEEASRKAIEAAKEAEAKRVEELKRKKIKQPGQSKYKGTGRKVNENPWSKENTSDTGGGGGGGSGSGNGGSDRGGGYNPMNPSSGHNRGYRPSRRSTGRSS